MDSLDLNFLRAGLIEFLLIFASLTVHEWAHAFAADALGDDTPRSQGRVTLNPFPHVDILGTIIVPLVSIFLFSNLLLGWGKPVITNPGNFRRPGLYDVLVSLAGPCANFGIALVADLAGTFLVRDPRTAEMLRLLIQLNVALGVFNLLPIPPLDGGYILRRLVGMQDATFIAISRWSGIVLLLALNLDAVREALTRIFLLAYAPYVYLCQWLNPAALPRLFGI